ncbi:MAG TPA: methyl-accepting chemotaxis protein [Patescibacteria group bacterium]|nr:methyl-accepting chemotaxis protein [Patescibacteria group bacterium]
MELKDLRIHGKEMEFLQTFFRIIIYAFEDGACFFLTDLTTVTYKQAEKFDIPGLDVGARFSPEGLGAKSMQARRTIVLELGREVYGVRVCGIGGPVWNDDDTEVIGSWGIATPRQHKIVQAFETFAPVLAELLPEGGFLAVNDLEKYIKRQGSKKFDISQLQVSTPIREGSVQDAAMKQKKLVIRETDEAVFGFPLLGAAEALVDEKTGAVVGAFSLAVPRKLARDLKAVAGSLDQGLTGVSASIQQITAATNDISSNQSQLHEEIEKVKGQLVNINNVMGFIREIADETKMLGLNAAIEAARVGEAGRGFGVVADEIRKLSEESKKTVAQIKELTHEIETSMNQTASASESTLAVTEETSAAVEEVNATIEEMTSLAGQLTQTAASL